MSYRVFLVGFFPAHRQSGSCRVSSVCSSSPDRWPSCLGRFPAMVTNGAFDFRFLYMLVEAVIVVGLLPL